MTLKEIEESGKEVLTCAEVAPVLKCNPATLHMQAMEEPWRLGFPVIVMGSRVKIPRRPFLTYMKEGVHEENHHLRSGGAAAVRERGSGLGCAGGAGGYGPGMADEGGSGGRVL